MDKSRPVRVFWQDKVGTEQLVFAIKAISKVLELAMMNEIIGVELGNAFDPTVHKNTDAGSVFFGKFDAGAILADFSIEQKVDNYDKFYTIFLIKDGIFFNVIKDGIKLVGGLAQPGQAAIVQADNSSFFGLSRREILSSIYRLTVHELGHIFNLPSAKREKEIKLSSLDQSRHCANNCVMQPDPNSKESFNKNIFCTTCLDELLEYFK